MTQLLTRTPIWVWIILFVIVKKGVTLMADNRVSLQRSCLIPLIFILWTCQTVVTKFSAPNLTLFVFMIMILPGTLISYYLYRNKRYYYQNAIFMQNGTALPLTFALLNFMMKYCLQVAVALHPTLQTSVMFQLTYALLSGISVGLFFGSIIRTVQAQNHLQTTVS